MPDLNVTVTIPAEQAERVLEAVCTDRWTPTVKVPSEDEDGAEVETPNPESREAFLQRTLVNYVNQIVADYERNKALAAAEDVEPVL